MTHDNKTEFFILFFSLYWLAAEFKMWLSFILQKEKEVKETIVKIDNKKQVL